MKIRNILISGFFLGSLGVNAYAAPTITVNGDLSDWGVTQNGNATDWNPTSNSGINFTIEDQQSDYLEPGYGGQDYDAEAIYAYKGQDTLFIALATGHNPEASNEGGSYGAGDFAIDFGADGSYEMGINIKPEWDGFGASGGVYKVNDWGYGLWEDGEVSGYVKTEHPTSIMDGELLGAAVLAISGPQAGYGEWQSDLHYFYEMSVDLDILRSAGWNGEKFNIHWTMNCANDSIVVDPPATVPTPGTFLLVIAGLIGFQIARNKNSGKLAA